MSKRILVVEDQEDNRRIVRDLLTRSGYEIIEAMTGEEGVTVAETQHPDLILMDIQLPVIDGYEAARRIVQEYPEALLAELEAQLQEAEEGFRKGQVDLLTFLELDSSASETFGRVLDAQRDLAAKAAELMAAAGERDALARLGSL